MFGPLLKIWENYELYIYPYIRDAKFINMLEDLIKKNHKNNLSNLFDVLHYFFSSSVIFEDHHNEHWYKNLISKISHL